MYTGLAPWTFPRESTLTVRWNRLAVKRNWHSEDRQAGWREEDRWVILSFENRRRTVGTLEEEQPRRWVVDRLSTLRVPACWDSYPAGTTFAGAGLPPAGTTDLCTAHLDQYTRFMAAGPRRRWWGNNGRSASKRRATRCSAALEAVRSGKVQVSVSVDGTAVRREDLSYRQFPTPEDQDADDQETPG